jgi:hypothetical protein
MMLTRLSLALVGLAAAGAQAANLPLEAYVSPPALFPDQEKFPAGYAKAYRPVPVYASPDGAPVGHVDTNYARCGVQCEDVTATLITADGKRQPLLIDYRAVSHQGLLTHDQPTVSGNSAWSLIRHAKGQFWIKTALKDIYSFEKLAMFADDFDTVCTQPGNCQSVTAAMRKHVKDLPFQGCFTYPYEVQGVTTVDGKRYYKVKLQDIELGKIKLQIPRSGFVPTRNKNGTHTGVLEAQGC